jgi:hypothetical protein
VYILPRPRCCDGLSFQLYLSSASKERLSFLLVFRGTSGLVVRLSCCLLPSETVPTIVMQPKWDLLYPFSVEFLTGCLHLVRARVLLIAQWTCSNYCSASEWDIL